MLIKLEPVSHEFNNCFQGQVETIVEEYYHKNYLLTQFFRWDNPMDVVNGKIQIVQGHSFYGTEEIEILGLKQVIVTCEDIEKLICKIKQELEDGTPVIVGIQIANCPWDPNYKKNFVMEHIIVVHGFSEKDNAFLCSDAIYKKTAAVLPIKEFRIGGSHNYRKIVKTDDKCKKLDVNELLLKQAKKMLVGKNNDFQRLRNIGRYIQENAGTIKVAEMQLDNVLFSETYMIIRDFAKAREMIAYVIQEYSQSKDKFILTELFEYVMKKWLSFRILYVRVSTEKNIEKKLIHMAELLMQIAQAEENIARYIIERDSSLIEEYLCKNSAKRRNDKHKPQHNIYNIREIEIEEYYNNKAFGIFDSLESACFSVSGEYMLYPSKDIAVSLWEGEKVNLHFSKQLDNVICNSQCIKIGLEGVKELILIGNKEFNGLNDELIVTFKDGTTQNVSLNFPEWYTEILKDEQVIVESNVISKEEKIPKETSFKGKIFMKKYVIKSNETIKYIRLPGSGRIHIFRIFVLCRKK